MRTSTLFLAVLMIAPGPMAGQNLVANGSFDSDLSEWNLNPVNATVAWTANGLPSGAIIMDGSAAVTPGGVVAETSACFQLEGGQHLLRADVFPEGVTQSGLCAVYYLRYVNSTDCTGSAASSSAQVDTDGAWTTLETPFFVNNPETNSFRIVLHFAALGGSGTRRCTIDNVSLTGPPAQTLEIPTAGLPGLVALGGGLLAAGLIVMRRHRSRASHSGHPPQLPSG